MSQVRGRAGASFISPQVQRDQIEAYARAHGHEVVSWQEDLDQPGSTLKRPGFQAALAAIGRGEADGVIGAKLDRITRSVAHLGTLLERAKRDGWNLIAVDVGLDMSTPNGKLVANVLGSVAEWELDRRRESWEEARSRAVARGVHIASRSPTGYRRGPGGILEPDPAYTEAIREAFERRAAGDGWKKVAGFLTDRGVVGPYGAGTWTQGAAKSLIENRVYLGEARSGRFVNVAAHEPLVGRQLWEQCQTAPISPQPRKAGRLLLAGIVRCAGCRYVMKADSMVDATNGERLLMYRCRTVHAAGRCPAASAILARVLEPHVEVEFKKWLAVDPPSVEGDVETVDLDSANMERTAAEEDMVAYVESDTLAIAGPDMFERGLHVRQERVDEAERLVREARNRSGGLGAIGRRELLRDWDKLPRETKHELFVAALDCVVVRKHRLGGPLADRVTLIHRGDAPAGLPRRGRRVPLEPWPDDPVADTGVLPVQDP